MVSAMDHNLNIIWFLSSGAKISLKFCGIQMSSVGEDKIFV
jgi:hypothetical protein